MPRLMYDSTSPWDIPRDAEMVAYYVDGRYAWPQEWLDMFPNAVKVSISAIGQRTAQVGDVEVGCIWPPANAVPWVLRARADGYDPTIYVNELNDWGPVRQAFRNAGVPEPHYLVARYNGVREIPPGAIGRQFAHPHDGDGVANNPWETGKHYDLSIVADYWPGVDNKAPGGGGGNEDDVSAADVWGYDVPDPTPEVGPGDALDYLKWSRIRIEDANAHLAGLDNTLTTVTSALGNLGLQLERIEARLNALETGSGAPVSDARIAEVAVAAVRDELND